MRMWIAQLERVNGRPQPVGLPEDVAWAVWVIEDRTPDENWHVLAFANTDLPPTAGRDVGDPEDPSFATDPLPRGATNQIADQMGYPRAAVRNRTRAEVVEFMTSDTRAYSVDRFWSKRVAEQDWEGIVWMWDHPDAAWFRSLTPSQRQFIRDLTPAQKAELRAASLDNNWAERRALLTSWAG